MPNTAESRVVDPVLTTVARGYVPEGLVASYLFPKVFVAQRGGKVIQFGAEAFAGYATGRAPGSRIRQVTFGYQGVPYVLEQNAIAAQIPIEMMEEARAVPGIEQQQVAIRGAMRIVDLTIERKAAALAAAAANYGASNKITLSGTSQWSSDDSDPAKQMETAVEAVRAGIGVVPNTLVLSRPAYRAIRNHPAVRARVANTAQRQVVNEQVVAEYFDVERVVVANAVEGTPGSFSDVWGKVAILAYTETSNLASMGVPSFGYTYRLMNYPVVSAGQYDPDVRSWLHDVVTEDTPVIAGKDAGYLFTNVTS